MNKDTVVGILGAVILVAAMVGIFYYEGTQAPAGAGVATGGAGPLSLNWTTSSVAGPSARGQTTEGDSTEERVNVSAANLTRIEFVLEWADDVMNSGPDVFNVTVTSPAGDTLTGTGRDGRATVTFSPVNPVPTATRGSQADLERLRTTNGTGTWLVVIELSDAGDVMVGPLEPPPVPGAPTEDTGNEWKLSTRLTSYEAQVSS